VAATAAVVMVAGILPGSGSWVPRLARESPRRGDGARVTGKPTPNCGFNSESQYGNVQYPRGKYLADDLAKPVICQTGTLPRTFRWSSGDALIKPISDPAHDIKTVKDPSAVYHDGKWHVFATVVTPKGLSLEYRSFTDWSVAASATPYFLDSSGIGLDNRAAPQVFWFAPQKLWYLVYQTGKRLGIPPPGHRQPERVERSQEFLSENTDNHRAEHQQRYWVEYVGDLR